MVWLVQNCRSNKYLKFLKPAELPGGLALLVPLPGLCLGPAGDLKRSPDPSPTHAPLTTNSRSAPDDPRNYLPPPQKKKRKLTFQRRSIH